MYARKMNSPTDQAKRLFQHFDTGATLSEAFRRTQLQVLQRVITTNEAKILAALKADLGKSAEEAYASEVGFVLHELRVTLRHLEQWMKPRKVKTNLLNLPGKSRIWPQPLGVVMIIAPWNYPFQLLMAPLIGAMAAGNCMLLKPSELAPHTAQVVYELLNENFEKDYLQVVLGDGAEQVPALLKTHRFDHVFFTGSTAVGQKIYALAAEKLVPVTLELGGKSPCIVAADADMKVAAKRIVFGKMINAGQTCVAPDYLLVEPSAKDKLVAALVAAVESMYGTALADSPEYGRIINQKQYDRLKAYLSQGQLIYGGQTNDAERFIGLSLLEHVPLDAPVMRDEIFGPVLPIFTYQTTEEAMQFVRRFPNPLSLYLFTNSSSLQESWARQVSFGGGCFNNTLLHLSNEHLPFGGVGGSGIGAYHGQKSFEVFSHLKSILSTPTWFDPALKYPPFAGRLGLLKRIMK